MSGDTVRVLAAICAPPAVARFCPLRVSGRPSGCRWWRDIDRSQARTAVQLRTTVTDAPTQDSWELAVKRSDGGEERASVAHPSLLGRIGAAHKSLLKMIDFFRALARNENEFRSTSLARALRTSLTRATPQIWSQDDPTVMHGRGARRVAGAGRPWRCVAKRHRPRCECMGVV